MQCFFKVHSWHKLMVRLLQALSWLHCTKRSFEWTNFFSPQQILIKPRADVALWVDLWLLHKMAIQLAYHRNVESPRFRVLERDWCWKLVNHRNTCQPLVALVLVARTLRKCRWFTLASLARAILVTAFKPSAPELDETDMAYIWSELVWRHPSVALSFHNLITANDHIWPHIWMATHECVVPRHLGNLI